ncbi:MAG: hypothetical protein KDA51_07390 [Planctomycetales bacterium]|nr:hypothetical protein [Planctomycetales bacterium]MCA9181259.1 hypothetical protein [Planctomycetales bacterium]
MKKILALLSVAGLTITFSLNSLAQAPQASTTDAQSSPPAGKMVLADAKLATLRAKFVYDGDAPAPKKVDSSKDPFCAQLEILSEALLVGKDGGLQNLVLMFDAKRSKAKVPAEFAKPVDGTVGLDNNGCKFVPHIVFARVGQTIEVLNSDQTGHNANFGFFNNPAQNFLIPIGGKKEIKLVADEATLMPVECNIHPWMKGYVIVQEHPYVGITDEAGQLEIPNLPVGEVTFLVRHENADGSIDEGTVGGKKQKWGRGRMEIELKPGMNDLGTITLAADKFKQ